MQRSEKPDFLGTRNFNRGKMLQNCSKNSLFYPNNVDKKTMNLNSS